MDAMRFLAITCRLWLFGADWTVLNKMDGPELCSQLGSEAENGPTGEPVTGLPYGSRCFWHREEVLPSS